VFYFEDGTLANSTQQMFAVTLLDYYFKYFKKLQPVGSAQGYLP